MQQYIRNRSPWLKGTYFHSEVQWSKKSLLGGKVGYWPHPFIPCEEQRYRYPNRSHQPNCFGVEIDD